MIIERKNTKFGEQIVLIAEEGELLVKDNIKTKTAYIGKGCSILDWKISTEYEEYEEEFVENTPNQEEIKQYLINGVQNYMDKKAQEKGYDGILSACSYINSKNSRFDTEGEKARVWRSEVWEFCYAYLDDVLAGNRPIPTLEELIEELPKIEW